MRNISNSEVQAWDSCRRLYWFAFVLNLKPKALQRALDRGTLGHEAMSVYITHRLAGLNHPQAMARMQEFWVSVKNVPIDVKMETLFLFDRYMQYHQGWPQWKLLGTEERVDLQLTDELTIPIRYDLMVEDIKTGKILVGDFKFTYDFWKPNDHSLNGQMFKYITVLQANGYKVDGGFLEEIRTRKLGAEKASDHRNLWKTTTYYPSIARRRNSLKQHIQTSLEIIDYRNLSIEEQEDQARPILNKHGACRFCSFAPICIAKLDGKDITFDIEQDYEQNVTYGYNFDEEPTVP